MIQYSDSASLDAVYQLLAKFAAPYDPGDARLDQVMVISDALVSCGERHSWASVWWAYGALHFDMGDESLDRALDLVKHVDAPSEARAAALIVQAEIKAAQSAYASTVLDASEQIRLLEAAMELAPDWPLIRLRLARAYQLNGNLSDARRSAELALDLLKTSTPSDDPFDSAFTGRRFDLEYVKQEIHQLGGTA